MEEALQIEPGHVELLTLKADLSELIQLATQQLFRPRSTPATTSSSANPSPLLSEITSPSPHKSAEDNNKTKASTTNDKTESEPDLVKSQPETTSEKPFATTSSTISKISASIDIPMGESDTVSTKSADPDPDPLTPNLPSGSASTNNDSNKSSEQNKNICEPSSSKKHEKRDPLNPCCYDPQGKKYTMHDFNQGKVDWKPARNYLWKKRKEINKMLINEHRAMQGLEVIRFRKNRGVKAREKGKIYFRSRSGSGIGQNKFT